MEVVGVDILDDMESDDKIRSMKRVARQVRAERVTPILADGARLPLRRAAFDCVLAIDSLSHADYMRESADLHESQRLIVEEMSELIRPGGKIAVIENSALSLRNMMMKKGSPCHPVNPFYLSSILRRLGFGGIRTMPHYDLAERIDWSARLSEAVLKRSKRLEILIAPWFMLKARKNNSAT